MKKLFIVLAVASLGFVACNSGESKPEETTDTITTAPAMADTMAVAPSVDTTMAADTLKK